MAMKKVMKKGYKMGGKAKPMKNGGKAISKSKQKGLAKLAKKKPSVVSKMGYDPKKMVAAMGGLRKAIAAVEKEQKNMMKYGGKK